MKTLSNGAIIESETQRSYRYFNDKSDPGLGGIDNMNEEFMEFLDEFRHQLGESIIINSGYRFGDGSSRHHSGNAVDCKCPSLTLREFYTAALRFQYQYRTFMGIGFYPFWNTPGLHLDFRDKPMRWVRGIGYRDYLYNNTLEDIDKFLDLADKNENLWNILELCCDT